MTYLFIFILGAIIGSFLNVCIYRMPREESIVFPGSRCVSCKKPIFWYDNIPLASYIFLKGKCRHCRARISPRYFLVELISAAAFLALFINFKTNYLFFVIYSMVTFALIVVTFIDFEFQIIPDSISISGIFLGIVLSCFFPALQNSSMWWKSFINSAIGALVGGGMIYLMGVFGQIVFKKEAMGGGDVKLMAMLGAFLGWKMAILIFFLAPLLGMPAGLYLKFVKKQDILPYGPYISMAGFIAMLWGNQILSLLIL